MGTYKELINYIFEDKGKGYALYFLNNANFEGYENDVDEGKDFEFHSSEIKQIPEIFPIKIGEIIDLKCEWNDNILTFEYKRIIYTSKEKHSDEFSIIFNNNKETIKDKIMLGLGILGISHHLHDDIYDSEVREYLFDEPIDEDDIPVDDYHGYIIDADFISEDRKDTDDCDIYLAYAHVVFWYTYNKDGVLYQYSGYKINWSKKREVDYDGDYIEYEEIEIFFLDQISIHRVKYWRNQMDRDFRYHDASIYNINKKSFMKPIKKLKKIKTIGD